jgi:FKBP-type peptidyl-prolyl cis-trans isomerase (trigger factor)
MAPKKDDTGKTKEPQLTWLADKTFELKFTISLKEVEKTQQEVIAEMAKDLEIAGFRKGKAPLKLVEEKIGPEKLLEHTVQHLVPLFYQQTVVKHHLHPIVSPKIKVISMEPGKDWVLQATSCEAPDITLGEYKKTVRGAIAADSLWVPGKGKPEEAPKPDKNQKLGKILEALIKDIKVSLPTLLIKTETDRMLSRLLEQIQKLGLTLEQYVQANGKTVEVIRKEYEALAARNLKIEFILQKISDTENIQIEDKEVEDHLDKLGDQQLRQQFDSSEEKAYLKMTLLRQKTIDFLLNI